MRRSAAGPGHPRVRQLLNVKHNRGRPAPRLVVLEGTWALGHAVAAGLEVEVAFACPSLVRGDECRSLLGAVESAGTPVFEVSERVLGHMVDRHGPDGVAALARLPDRTLDDLRTGPSTVVVVADAFELAGNLGTLVRCADGAGAAAVLVTERKVRLSHPLVLKASMATLLTTPVVDCTRGDAVAWARRHGVRVVVADPGSPLHYRQADWSGPVAVVLGSERQGLAPEWRAAADAAVSIPMCGVADSLNVGHAAALLLYEALAARTPGESRGSAGGARSGPRRSPSAGRRPR